MRYVAVAWAVVVMLDATSSGPAFQLPAEAGYYVVGPRETEDVPKIQIFRGWLLSAAKVTAAA